MIMSRVVRRMLGLLAMLVLLLSSSGDALTRHRCAHHDALPDSPAEAHHHHGDESAPADDASGCTCIGTCTVTSAALAPLAAVVEHEPVPVADVVQRASVDVVAPSPAPFLLPYSTAPPASL